MDKADNEVDYEGKILAKLFNAIWAAHTAFQFIPDTIDYYDDSKGGKILDMDQLGELGEILHDSPEEFKNKLDEMLERMVDLRSHLSYAVENLEEIYPLARQFTGMDEFRFTPFMDPNSEPDDGQTDKVKEFQKTLEDLIKAVYEENGALKGITNISVKID